jgi:NAD(P)-dependent dehydrogenase (short-subunit alcohol dehydrogenase family)
VSDRPVAIITGANSGIGLAVTRALAQQGWKVYGTFRNHKRARPLMDFAKTLPVVPIAMDVDKTSSVKKAIGLLAKKEKGRVDFLLNNAGFVMAGFWEDLSDEDLRAQFETNVFGLLRVTREVLPLMRRRERGKIINVGSVGGLIALPVLGPYSATKFAVRSLTDALRMEAGMFGVEVSELVPSEIRTAVVENARRAERALSQDSAYSALTRDFEKFSQERFKHAAPVEKLVKVVLKALSDKPMRRRYLVKGEDHALYFIKRFLPDFLLEAALASQFPWHKTPAAANLKL